MGERISEAVARRAHADAPGGHARLTRDAVLTAAARLVDEEGIERLTLTRVATRLRVTQPALYNHVDSAAGLLRDLALAARTMLGGRVRDAAVGRSGDDAVAAVAEAWRGFVREHPGLYAATDRCPLADDAEMEAVVADYVDVLRRVVAGYGLSDEQAGHGAWSLRSALHGFVTLEAERGHPGPLDLDESFRRLVGLLCAGFHGMAEAPDPAPGAVGRR